MDMQHAMELRGLARRLRQGGLSYQAIARELETPIPLATLKRWCEGLEAEKKVAGGAGYKGTVRSINQTQLSLVSGATANDVKAQARHRATLLVGNGLAKDKSLMLLVGLYLMGNYDNKESQVDFSSGDDRTIKLFISLMRDCYSVDERKFRVAVVCGADVEAELLMRSWSQVTEVPLAQFYEPEIAPSKLDRRLLWGQGASLCTVSYLSEYVLMDIQALADKIVQKIGGADVDISVMVKENIAANKR